MNTQNTQTPINTRAAWRPVLRPIAKLLIAAQLALVLQPLSALTLDKGATPFNPAAQAQLQRYAQLNQTIEQAKAEKVKEQQGPADQVSERLKQAQELVAQIKRAGTPDKPAKVRQLKGHLSAIQAGTADVRADFAATRTDLQQKNLPAEILARHDEAVAQFEERSAQFNQIAGKPSDEQIVDELASFFDKFPAKRKPGKIDPKKLPWSTPKPNTRAPAETQTAWYQNLYADQKIRLAQTGTNIGPLQFNIPPEPGQAPTLADLAETDEVQLTPEIRAKSAELGNNPVNIYNWVRNTIEFAPTAGAIQSAQDTLDKKRGNATDTASLLIALLRAANIPARYQYGTIDVDADKVQNWVGGTTVPQAALQILNQGGIAARGITSGGRFTTIRMEHVWVNAYVNWSPSRGGRQGGWNMNPPQHVNPNAQLNAWTPLDGSFKQYNYTAGVDLKTAVPLDANALLDAAKQGATINEAEGWVQNLNQAAIQSQLTDYQSRLKAYIDSTATGANSTVGDVIGKKIIPVRMPQLLAGVLPNPVVLQGAQVSAIPTGMQHKFTYRLYASDYDQANDSPMLVFTDKTSKLVGKRLTLSYVPATQADADLIASYLPKPHADGSPLQPSEMPTSLPGYLIRVKAQVNLDGQVIAHASQALQMGTDLYSTGGFTQLYNATQWDLTSEESNVAGQATAIGVSAGGISVAQLTQLKDRLVNAQTQLQAGNFLSLRGEQVSGDLLTANIWTWFNVSDRHNRLSQTQAGIVENPGLSYGLFHAVVNPIYSWGVIRSVKFPGVNIDVGHVRNITWAKDNDPAKWAGYNRLRGQYMSALEHGLPERFFGDSSQCDAGGTASSGLPPCPQGISAMKAIGLAAQGGQKIYTITREIYANNPNIVSAKLWAHSLSTKDRIQQAMDAGYDVTIHEAPISVSGWMGAGFTLIDPATGAGGYLIEGGTSGGVIFVTWMSFIFVGLAAAALLTGGALFIALGLLALNIFSLISAINAADNSDQLMQAHAYAAIAALTAGLGVVLGAGDLIIRSLFWLPTIMNLMFRWADYPPNWLLWLVL
jgi:hypothetical protein